jgi:protein TonB
VAPRPLEEAKFVAPIEVPTEIAPEESLDLGVEGGVPGGVEGGVPGGVVGGIVGGLPAAEAAPVKVVRVGGHITAPKLVRKVEPVYPALAAQARLSAIVILEAQVDTRGHVKSVTVLRGAPLFDEPALEAVRQWRYQPLLLNGQPTEFILTVTLVFKLQSVAPGA